MINLNLHFIESQQQFKTNQILNQLVLNVNNSEGQLQINGKTLQTLEVPQINEMRRSNSRGGGEDRSFEEESLNVKKPITKLKNKIKSIIKQKRKGDDINIPDSPKMNNIQQINNIGLFEGSNKMQNITHLDVLHQQEEILQDDKKIETNDCIQIFTNNQLYLTFIFFFWLSALENGQRPFLAKQLADQHNLSDYGISYLFRIPIFTYLLSAIFVVRQTYFQQQTLLKIGMWVLGISFFFYCPTLFKLPNFQGFIIFGEFIRGISLGIGCVLFIPNISDSCIDKVGIYKSNLIGANLYQFGWSLGEILGPIICGALIRKFGYDLTTLFSGLIIIVLTIIHIIFRNKNSIVQVFSNENFNSKALQYNNA